MYDRQLPCLTASSKLTTLTPRRQPRAGSSTGARSTTTAFTGTTPRLMKRRGSDLPMSARHYRLARPSRPPLTARLVCTIKSTSLSNGAASSTSSPTGMSSGATSTTVHIGPTSRHERPPGIHQPELLHSRFSCTSSQAPRLQQSRYITRNLGRLIQ